MKIIITFFLCTICTLNAITQTISGKITDKTTGETLIGATVYDKISNRGVTSNGFGFFSLAIPKTQETVEIECAYLGYTPMVLKLRIKNDTTLQIKLSPSNNLLNEVVITGEKKIEDRIETGVIKMTSKDIEKLPQIGGEADVIKAFQLTPGVKSGGEGSSGMYVRGGSPDQNLMLLDDVPLYYVNHMGGFVSTFNADAINSATLIKGGFPARYGSRLSSVMDIRTVDGNKTEHHGSYNIGMIALKASVQGPVKKDTSSYFLSFRRLMYDVFMRGFSRIAFKQFVLSYSFFDINGKYNHTFNENNRIYFSLYAGQDRYLNKYADKKENIKSSATMQWGNVLTSFRFNHIFNEKLFSNTTLYFTKYHYDILRRNKFENQNDIFDFRSQINDISLKSDVDYHPFSWYTIRTGFHDIQHFFIPSSSKINVENTTDQSQSYKLKAHEFNLYLENECRISSHINTNIGIRNTNYFFNHHSYFGLEPRILINIKPGKNYALKLAYSEMKQYVHMLTNAGAGMPADYWVPTTEKIKPEYCKQYSAALVKTTKNGKYELSLEIYSKTMTNLIDFKDGIGYLTASEDWQNLVETNGVGTSKGIELFIQKKKGKSTGWIGYTLSKTDRTFSNLNNGITFPFKYDSRHDISFVFKQQLKKNLHFSLTWVYNTGKAFTQTLGVYNTIETAFWIPNNQFIYELNTGDIYSSRNAYRMKSYHRMDIGLQWEKQKKRGIGTWNFSIYNAYNRLNPYYYYWTSNYDDGDGRQNNVPKLFQETLFPIFPSIGYKFEW